MRSPRAVGRLDGSVAVVTGAASGIGRASALELASRGARLVVGDLESAVDETAAEIVGQGGEARSVTVDVTNSACVGRLVETSLDVFGRLDVMVNNAGVTGPLATIADLDEREFDAVVAVNLKGVFLGTKHALPPMIAQGSGSIINVSSAAAVRAFPGLAAYTASKHGVVGLTRVAAVEAGRHGVRVNALLPGPTATPMTAGGSLADRVPLGREADPREQASMVCFLASSESSFVNGAAILADGGMAFADRV